jgi:hypothetical protein
MNVNDVAFDTWYNVGQRLRVVIQTTRDTEI